MKIALIFFNLADALPKMKMPNTEVSQLHAATCLAITQFNKGTPCPCLAKRIVLLLRYLATHPEMPLNTTSKNVYLNLLEYWEKVYDELKRMGRPGNLTYH